MTVNKKQSFIFHFYHFFRRNSDDLLENSRKIKRIFIAAAEGYFLNKAVMLLDKRNRIAYTQCVKIFADTHPKNTLKMVR